MRKKTKVQVRYLYKISFSVIFCSKSHLSKHLYNICTMLAQRRRRWADVVQMLYKCLVLAWILSYYTTRVIDQLISDLIKSIVEMVHDFIQHRNFALQSQNGLQQWTKVKPIWSQCISFLPSGEQIPMNLSTQLHYLLAQIRISTAQLCITISAVQKSMVQQDRPGQSTSIPRPSKHETFTKCWVNVGPPSLTHWADVSRQLVCNMLICTVPSRIVCD